MTAHEPDQTQRPNHSTGPKTPEGKSRCRERKQEAAEAMKQAKLLYGLAKAQGKPYKPEAYFITAPEVRESVFSTTEVARALSQARLLYDAQQYEFRNVRFKQNKPEQPVEAAAA